MRQNLLTIITTVERGKEVELRDALRKYDRVQQRLVCESADAKQTRKNPKEEPAFELDFRNLANLHLASFLVLEPEIEGANDERGNCSLVFESTFDGSPEAFISDVAEVCCDALGDIYKHCVGFPSTESAAPQVVHQYLLKHHVPSNTSYAGSPGKTVAEVIGESQLRNRVSEFLTTYRNTPGSTPPTYEYIRNHISRKVIRDENPETAKLTAGGRPSPEWESANGKFRWAEGKPEKPFLTRHGPKVLAVLAILILAAIAIVIGFVAHWMCWLDFWTVVSAIKDWDTTISDKSGLLKEGFEYFQAKPELLFIAFALWFFSIIAIWQYNKNRPGPLLFDSTQPQDKFGSNLEKISYLLFTVFFILISIKWGALWENDQLHALFVIAFLWFACRTAIFFIKLYNPDPRHLHFFGTTGLRLLGFVRALALWLLYTLGFLLVLTTLKDEQNIANNPFSLEQLGSWTFKLFNTFGEVVGVDSWKFSVSDAFYLKLAGCVALVLALCLMVIIRYARTNLEILSEIRHLTNREKGWRHYKLDVVNLSLISLGWFVLAYIVHAFWSLAQPFSVSTLLGNIFSTLETLVIWGLIASVYFVLALALIFLVYVIIVLFVFWTEWRDSTKYVHAEELTKTPKENVRNYSREEHGINTYQNHLASLTCVKPGLFRMRLLRLTLWLANLRAHYIFTKGNLAGIPTILYARWVLINRGRRLLFLTNYGGAWESYLNEFIDMKAVKGLNAIWTHTHLPRTEEAGTVGFPPTHGLFWKGAQLERPFKAYVRKSQVETLFWYSAYPNLSIRNIVDNGRLRDGLVEGALPSEMMDDLAKRL